MQKKLLENILIRARVAGAKNGRTVYQKSIPIRGAKSRNWLPQISFTILQNYR